MKDIFRQLRRPTRRIFLIGFSAGAAVVTASAVFYFGAGIWWDYYPSISKSEWLLANSRPLGFFVCLSSVIAEYYAVKKL